MIKNNGMTITGILVWMALSWAHPSGILADSMPETRRNYTYLYYENGFPTPLAHRRPQSEANLAARANPDLVFQTGYYSLMLDCDDIMIKGYDALAGSDYRTALDQDVTVFSAASNLLLRVYQGGVAYDCDTAVVQDASGNHVRLIESGQYVQRIDHLGLIFRDAGGNALTVDDDCRLEISAWPDRVTFLLDFSSETLNPITRSVIQIISPDGTVHLDDQPGSQARLTLKPQDDASLAALNVNDYITEAINLQDDSALAAAFDEDVYAFNIQVPANSVKYPSGINRVDEYRVEVTNPSDVAQNIPLVFEQPSPPAITGTVMLLSDADTGRPLGIPVQLSKNWHWKDSPRSRAHYGNWYRGSTMLTLEPGESRRFKLRVVYGYWGGAGTASHAQLSLIGWGSHWKWDESALGAWGESLTYDPTLHAGAAFLDDIRPTFTPSYSDWTPYADNSDTNTHNWTENTGGGDFLIYRDSANIYHWVKRLKTCYHQVGPNLTEVYYSGVTDDDRIRVTYASRMGSTLDYHRHFHDYTYEFLQDVISPQRLVFYQMAADYYSAAYFDNYYIGDETGMLLVGGADVGGNVYKGTPVRLDGRWLSVDDNTGNGTSEIARSLRGIIPLSSKLNGSSFPLYVHPYGRTWGSSTMLFDLSASSVHRSYSAGDVVAGELEFIMPPQHLDNYWGGDPELINRLTGYGDTAWEVVRDEFVQNIQMNVTLHQGTLLRSYPLEIEPDAGSTVLADVSINGGGIGHVPVVLRGADAGLELQAQRLISGIWTDLQTVDIDNNTYYQAVQSADGTVDYTFSIPRPSLDLTAAWRMRICVKPTAGANATSFENGFEGWINRTDDDFDWSRHSGGTPSSGTGPDAAPDGDYYIYTEASGNYPGKTAVISNRVDLSTSSAKEMTFDYHMYGDGGMGSLHLDVFDGAVWYPDVWAVTGSQHSASGDPWTTVTVDLSPYTAGGMVDVLFRGITGNGFRSDMAVDHVRVGNPIMPPPYEKWASDFALTYPNAGSSANPDEDVLINLYEYGFGGDPTNGADIGHVPTYEMVSQNGTNYMEYTYARRIGSGDVLNYQLETRSDLLSGDWTEAGHVELPVVGMADAEFEAVTNHINTTGKTNEFIRLQIKEQ